MQKFLLPDFYNYNELSKMTTAWYNRTIKVPDSWKNRRIVLDIDMVQTKAKILIDRRVAGEITFPGGKLDVTDYIIPGTEQELSILVAALPLDVAGNAFMAPDRVVERSRELKLPAMSTFRANRKITSLKT